jgi:hypothetical protein
MKSILIACVLTYAYTSSHLVERAKATPTPPLTTVDEIRTFTHSYPGQQYGYGAQGVMTDDYIGIRRSIGNGPPTLLGALFIHDPATGELLYQLAPPPQLSNTNYFFGAAFDIQGDLAVATAEFEHLPMANGMTAYNAGAAYLYDLTTGELRHKLVPEQPLFNGDFGGNVAVYGNTVAVSSRGYAYLFDATTGQQIARLDGGPQAVPGKFGGPLALNESLLLVTGIEAGHEPEQNSVFVYDLATLTLQRIIRPLDVIPQDAFGTRIALDGNNAAITSYYYAANTRHFGAVYVFDVQTGQQQAKLFSTPEVGLPNGFGYSIDILGDQLIVGAPGDNGTALLYDWTTEQALAKFTHAGVQSLIQFGSSVSLSNRYALVGTAPINVGPNAAYQYHLVPEPGCCALFAIAAALITFPKCRSAGRR